MIGIYGIYSNSGVCLYIGQSKDIRGRWVKHVWKLENSCHLNDFSSWYDKHCESSDDLIFKVLCLCDDKNYLKNQLEVLFFEKENPLFYGKKPSNKEEWEQSPQTRSKISETLRNKTLSRLGYIEEDIKSLCFDPEVSFKEASKIVSINVQTLRWFLRYKGWEFVYPEKTEYNLKINQVLRLRSDGKSLRAIGKELNLNYETVRRYIIKHNSSE